ncbi:MAG TPA: acyl-CoA thioesterase [Gammaproteobacteria bacterium]|nr:acyl-CoA thioesterase [Gammaproteobacteria bacterium]
MKSAETELTVPFHDVDALGVVWHGRYVKYLEIVRCQLLESFQYGYEDMLASGYAWPVVDLRIQYAKPLRYGQRIRLKATLAEWEYRLKIKYLITDAASGLRLSKGYTVQAAVDLNTEQMCYETPPVLWQKLGLARP